MWEYDYPYFHDLAIVWDPDFDERIMIVAERLWLKGLLKDIIAIGEHKGTLDYFLREEKSEIFRDKISKIAENVDGDCFHAQAMDISDSDELVGLNLLFGLGTKPCMLVSDKSVHNTKCSHGTSFTLSTIEQLPESQAGVGRHKCAACAYAQGYKDGCNQK